MDNWKDGRVVTLGFARHLVRRGWVRHLGFARLGAVSFAVLSPWGGPAPLLARIGIENRPEFGVRGPGLAYVESFSRGD